MALETVELIVRQIGADVERKRFLGRFDFNVAGTEIIGIELNSADGSVAKELTVDNAGKLLTGGVGASTQVEESFASTNARFFGEIGIPSTQGWTDSATGSTTIDLIDEVVFGITRQVVRINDDVSDGAAFSQFALTAQNWTDINAFGASFSGTSRLDTVDGASGFFGGLQANAAENPLATGNRRYGILFNNDGGNLRVTEPDTGSTTVTFDGTGGNPLIAFDEWVLWECVVLPGLGAAQFYINGILTTFAPAFLVNSGGLGSKAIVSSGSTSGVNRITYHDNFGVIVYEESETKILAAVTMDADLARVFIPEGKRDYTIVLPDGNPRPIGARLDIVANNVLGTVKLTNQVLAVPEILYNGLRVFIVLITSKSVLSGTNTVNNANIYIGFEVKSEDVARNIPEPIDWDAGTGNPSTVTSGDFSVFELRDGVIDGVLGDYRIQSTVDLSTVNPTLTICFVPTVTGAGNANVRFQLTMRYVTVGELTTKTADEILLETVAVIDTADEMHIVTFTLDRTKMAANDTTSFDLVRLGGDAADTYTGRIGIIEHADLEIVR